MNPLKELYSAGQSFWLDNLTRDMLTNGELERRIQEQDLRGLTSNPAIFNKAIAKSTLYDAQIQELALQNKSTKEIYEAIVVQDVQNACDVLRPVYDSTAGEDGFASLEVSPYLAHDTAGTLEEARYLFRQVNRPNVMIKVPGTEAGVPAIERLLTEGVNINITLLFGIDSYEQVAKAYVRAMEERLRQNKPVDSVASVASFFLSRIDVLVDALLGHRALAGNRAFNGIYAESLLGQAGVASAKLAYQRFQEIFSGKSWQKPAQAGGRVQRLLWASTGTKNPDYRDVMYVEPLIGRHTITTLPEETVAAFADHGRVQPETVLENPDAAKKVFTDLQKIGINMDFVAQQLVNEGIQKFIDPFDELVLNIERKKLQFIAAENSAQHQRW